MDSGRGGEKMLHETAIYEDMILEAESLAARIREVYSTGTLLV